jgi:hypothetical protein
LEAGRTDIPLVGQVGLQMLHTIPFLVQYSQSDKKS